MEGGELNIDELKIESNCHYLQTYHHLIEKPENQWQSNRTHKGVQQGGQIQDPHIRDPHTEIGSFPMFWQNELENVIFKRAYFQYSKDCTVTICKSSKKFTKFMWGK